MAHVRRMIERKRNHPAGQSILLAVAALSFQAARANAIDSLVRTDLSEARLVVREGSKSVRDVANGAPRAFLFLSATLSESACRALAFEMKRVRSFGLPVDLVVRTNTIPNECVGLTALVASAELQTKLKLADANEASALAIVVDGDGVVRFADNLRGSQGAAAHLADQLIWWDQGRQSFSVHCGHCHGDDGAETTYVGIKTLAGVSTRLSDQKIIEGGEMFGSVPTSTWSDKDRTILLQFIRGL
ncbi:MAG: hypothetical protein J0H49_09260 [Acidobacteria bacterium]|nr:hypothetical protein [Acidobacteriota bacterium]